MERDEPDFTTIVEVDRVRRLPRVGKLALGIKQKTGDKEYPKEVDYFVPRPDGFEGPSGEAIRKKFIQVYGESPKWLDIVLPCEDERQFFPYAFKFYGKSGLKCIGNGIEAKQMGSLHGKEGDEANEFDIVECPNEECPFYIEGKCKKLAKLTFMLPKVTTAGYFQIDTSSWNSRVDVMNDLTMVRANFGRVSNLITSSENGAETVLLLTREPKETMWGGRNRTHWTMHVRIRKAAEMDLAALQRIRLPKLASGLMLEAPSDDDVPRDLVPVSQLRDEQPAPAPPPPQVFIDCDCGVRYPLDKCKCCPVCGLVAQPTPLKESPHESHEGTASPKAAGPPPVPAPELW